MTPLHFATYGGHFGCVCILLAAKADVHAATRSVYQKCNYNVEKGTELN